MSLIRQLDPAEAAVLAKDIMATRRNLAAAKKVLLATQKEVEEYSVRRLKAAAREGPSKKEVIVVS